MMADRLLERAGGLIRLSRWPPWLHIFFEAALILVPFHPRRTRQRPCVRLQSACASHLRWSAGSVSVLPGIGRGRAGNEQMSLHSPWRALCAARRAGWEKD